MKRIHDMPFGAAVLPDGGVRFRLWAPSMQRVDLRLNTGGSGRTVPMDALDDGWFEAVTTHARAGTRYMFALENGMLVPDPASRDQAGDVHGWSVVVDPGEFAWRDAAWRGRPWHETVVYELHVGSFSRSGTYAGVADRLDELKALGVTAIELMPVAEAPGDRNWGYDGVYLYAPDSTYGRPRDLKLLVEAAHAKGLMIFLDVVYNHFGPEGNYLPVYAAPFFTDRHRTPWGAAINYDGNRSRPVRDFMIHNALYWLEEYNFDGLRLDAVHAIIDESTPNILDEIAQTVRARLPDRQIHLVLENDDNAARFLARGDGGGGYDAQWNDDLHHALHTLVSGQADGYYGDYAKRGVWHLGRALAEGFSYQGEASEHRGGARRGEPSRHLPPTAFVAFLQNHDQVGNNAMGERISHVAPPEAVRAAAAVYLLAPSVPLLFMGEEWGASSPFPFFCDFGEDLADSVREGRRKEFARFEKFRDPAARERIPDPLALATFRAAQLDRAEQARSPHAEYLAHYRRLLEIRHKEIVPRLPGVDGNAGTFEAGDALGVAWRLGDGSRLTLDANLSAREAPGRPRPGRVLFATHEADGARLPPWSVVWRIEGGA